MWAREDCRKVVDAWVMEGGNESLKKVVHKLKECERNLHQWNKAKDCDRVDDGSLDFVMKDLKEEMEVRFIDRRQGEAIEGGNQGFGPGEENVYRDE
ncbi:uncharacterized protein A4U43_C01F19230 [Asparagus officinalis]|uniref:Uncharacterized protein n=1 Tax=Asparagus officinalis TaxID=4686 RepID=A0A5P1FRD3_ASPOF|nr:uncharacterized protein A4U43_C01F19230 [Asparagus officinalis]